MEAVHNEAERLNQELEEVTSKIRSLYEKQSKNDTRINQLGVQIVEKQRKISEALRQAESRKQDEKERQRLEKRLPDLSREIAELSENIADAQLVLPTMEAEEQELIKRQRDAETDSEQILADCKSNLGDLSRMRNAIEEYAIHAVRMSQAPTEADVAQSCRFMRENRQGQLNKLCVEVEQRENDKMRLKGMCETASAKPGFCKAHVCFLTQGKLVLWNKTLRVSAKATPIRVECYATCRTSSTSVPSRQTSVRGIYRGLRQTLHEPQLVAYVCRGNKSQDPGKKRKESAGATTVPGRRF
jgi:hypothetical protein